MRAVEAGPRHTPPLREGVMRSASFGRRHLRRARPRSAVTVSLNAPGLAPLTGFSRSGGPIHDDRLGVRPNRHFSREACRGLEADGRVCPIGGAQHSIVGGGSRDPGHRLFMSGRRPYALPSTAR